MPHIIVVMMNARVMEDLAKRIIAVPLIVSVAMRIVILMKQPPVARLIAIAEMASVIQENAKPVVILIVPPSAAMTSLKSAKYAMTAH